MPWPSSWKRVTTSSCLRSDGFVAVGLEKLHTRAVAGYRRDPEALTKPLVHQVSPTCHGNCSGQTKKSSLYVPAVS